MICFLNSIGDLLNPQSIIQYGGLALLLFVIFAETGLFFGFFLPGDSLLFTAGLLTTSDYIDQPVGFLIIMLIVAAVSGSTVGYWFGLGAERFFKDRKENFFYKRKYIDITQDFYGRYGMMAFILGRFMPIVRTFVPILAGIVKIRFWKFFFYNVLGATLWIVIMVMSGYLLGNSFPGIVDYLEIIVVSMIVVSAIPIIVSWFRHRKNLIKD